MYSTSVVVLLLHALAGNAVRFVPFPENPIIKGHNIFAAEMMKVQGRWRCYYGGWQERGQFNDRATSL